MRFTNLFLLPIFERQKTHPPLPSLCRSVNICLSKLKGQKSVLNQGPETFSYKFKAFYCRSYFYFVQNKKNLKYNETYLQSKIRRLQRTVLFLRCSRRTHSDPPHGKTTSSTCLTLKITTSSFKESSFKTLFKYTAKLQAPFCLRRVENHST